LALCGAVIVRMLARSGAGHLRMQALCGGYSIAPAPAPVRGGVLRKRGLGLLAAWHS